MVLSTWVRVPVVPFFQFSYFSSQLGGPLPPSPRARVLEGEGRGHWALGTRASGRLGKLAQEQGKWG